MRVTMFWHGGSNYAAFDTNEPRDAEVFDTLESAKHAFAARTNDRYYPCVDDCEPDEGGPEAWLFFGKAHPVIGGDYPDRVMSFGPRGGVIVSRA